LFIGVVVGGSTSLVAGADVLVVAEGVIRRVDAAVGCFVAGIVGTGDAVLAGSPAYSRGAYRGRVGLAEPSVTDLDAVAENPVGALGVLTTFHGARVTDVEVFVTVTVAVGVNVGISVAVDILMFGTASGEADEKEQPTQMQRTHSEHLHDDPRGLTSGTPASIAKLAARYQSAGTHPSPRKLKFAAIASRSPRR